MSWYFIKVATLKYLFFFFFKERKEKKLLAILLGAPNIFIFPTLLEVSLFLPSFKNTNMLPANFYFTYFMHLCHLLEHSFTFCYKFSTKPTWGGVRIAHALGNKSVRDQRHSSATVDIPLRHKPISKLTQDCLKFTITNYVLHYLVRDTYLITALIMYNKVLFYAKHTHKVLIYKIRMVM